MVQVWMDLHREELLADWELAKEGIEPFRIDPLKCGYSGPCRPAFRSDADRRSGGMPTGIP